MASGLLSLKWNHHRSTFLHVLANIRQKESYCDVTLACAGKFYSAHKLVLSTCSEYFEEMFERTQCKHPVIVLKDIGADELEALLSYMYDGEVNVLQENLSSLIKAAECLKIKGLAVADSDPSEHSSKSTKDKNSSSNSKDVHRSHNSNSTSNSNNHSFQSDSSSRPFRNTSGGVKRPSLSSKQDDGPSKRRRPEPSSLSSAAASPARRQSSERPGSAPRGGGGAADGKDGDDGGSDGGEVGDDGGNSMEGAPSAADDQPPEDGGPEDARSFAQGLSEQTGVKAEPVEIIDSDDMGGFDPQTGDGGSHDASDAEFTEEKFAGGGAGANDPSLWGGGANNDMFSQPSTSSFTGQDGSNSNDNNGGGGGKGGGGGGAGGGSSEHLRPEDQQQHLHGRQVPPSSNMTLLGSRDNSNSRHPLHPSSSHLISPDSEQSSAIPGSTLYHGSTQYYCSRCPYVTDDFRSHKLHSKCHCSLDFEPGEATNASVTQGHLLYHPAPPPPLSSQHQHYDLSENESNREIEMISQVLMGQTGASSAGSEGGPSRTGITELQSPTEAGEGVGGSFRSGVLGHETRECPFCSFTTSKPSVFDSHVKTHTGEKPFSCTICSKGFSRKNNLQVHMKIHTGEKPFACPECSYRSSQKSNLKLHMLSHSGVKPYVCPCCDYKSAQKINLKMHIYKKHPQGAPQSSNKSC